MKINELSKITSIETPTIRYYESLSLLTSNQMYRDKNNYRQYYDSAIDRINLIKKLKKANFSLSEIKEIVTEIDTDSVDNELAIKKINSQIKHVQGIIDNANDSLNLLTKMLAYRKSL